LRPYFVNVKLLKENNENKKKFILKLQFHMADGSNELMIPKLANSHKYNLQNYIDNDNKIKAIGYGSFGVKRPFQPVIFERRAPRQYDVVIMIHYASVCHSDWHYITGEWKANFPLITGHEVVGKIIRLGKNAKKFSLGDSVAVGAPINSCRVCRRCRAGEEQYCEKGATYAYNSRERNPGDETPTGDPTFGGFSNIMVVNQDFVYHVPKNLPLYAVAPLTDAGLTVYAPLKRFVKPGMKVGVAGIGGLGHMAIKLAKALGAYVVAITTSEWKLDDSIRIGADESVLITDEMITEKYLLREYSDNIRLSKYYNFFDLIIDTIPVKHNLDDYLQLLDFNGRLHIVGNFDKTCISLGNLDSYNSISGSVIGGIPDMKEMFDLCSDNLIVADIELIPIQYLNKTYERLLKKNVKYRFVVDIINTLQ
jgi:uncharacterized zinc-type alcohol dehydrogenase-like protein